MAGKSSGKNDMQMKAFIIVALIAAFIGGYLVARAKYKPQIAELSKMVLDKDDAMNKMKADANKIIMKDGKMWVIEDGIVREMDSDMMMPNGSKVMLDGKVVNSDGDEMMMRNGDAMDMEGTMMPNGGASVNIDSSGF